MGNRDKLLEGALRCLHEKGFAQTTARDIATAAGVSLAAIGYHFGTTEALLNAALIRAMENWGEELDEALNDERDAALPPAERFVAVWTRVIDSVTANRPLWTTQFELVTQIGHHPERALQWNEAQDEAQFGLAELFHGIDADGEPELARIVGGLYQALLTGVVVQHIVSPEVAMSGSDLITALREVARRLGGERRDLQKSV
ncbi:TetR/AcrR family transcriptional regulator [Dactylosporangium roseum]|uniref:TetR/AcrR family transcriptional regulator n=1 Tax=Dactylosporangium roseum TaxID=47989 RepID=A0ABY5ZCT4_9ACTN|nr:TetR family transcriptional regulator [Dactylosporangium roseum]UWZ38508.1 TetR/AcrR family transcriptional regulator [Dactylosporangium roseum]